MTVQLNDLRAEFVGNHCGPGSLLDYGCGLGSFVRAYRRLLNAHGMLDGQAIAGYDINPACQADWMLTIDAAARRSWDIVTFFDSLEHLPDPAGPIRALAPRYVVASVPWCHHPRDVEWFMSWKHRRSGEHLWHFDRQSLDGFLDRLGYERIGCSHIEDVVRGSGPDGSPNILTAAYVRA